MHNTDSNNDRQIFTTHKILKLLRLQLVWLVPLVFYLLQSLMMKREQWGEIYAERIFPVISAPLVLLSSALPLSFLFLTVLLLPVALLLLVIKIWQKARMHEGKWPALRKLGYRLLTFFASIYVLFMLMHGFNYSRNTLDKQLNLDIIERSSEDLFNVSVWLAEAANQEKELLHYDTEGRLELQEERKYYLKQATQPLPGLYPSTYVRPKAVPLSQYWSYTNITGMYFPFLAEANVNADTMPDEFLFSALHEIAHVNGFAKEEEANFLAFYSGIHHPERAFRYAAYETAFIYAYNRLFVVSPELAAEAWNKLSDLTLADIQARSKYWEKYQGPVEEISTNINDAFLKANAQEAGVKSYGLVVDLLIAYYYGEILA